MKKGEIYKGIVDAIDFPNKGILWIDGEKVIVKNVLPGQEIRFAVNKKQKGRIEGRLLEAGSSTLLIFCIRLSSCEYGADALRIYPGFYVLLPL